MNEIEAWKEILDEWRKLDRLKRLNQRLYDYLGSSIIYLLEYSKRNGIVLPHKERIERIERMIVESEYIIDQINSVTSPKNQHPNGTPEDSTEPKITCLQSIFYKYYKIDINNTAKTSSEPLRSLQLMEYFSYQE